MKYNIIKETLGEAIAKEWASLKRQEAILEKELSTDRGEMPPTAIAAILDITIDQVNYAYYSALQKVRRKLSGAKGDGLLLALKDEWDDTSVMSEFLLFLEDSIKSGALSEYEIDWEE